MLAFSPDGHRLAIGGDSGILLVLDCRSLKVETVKTDTGAERPSADPVKVEVIRPGGKVVFSTTASRGAEVAINAKTWPDGSVKGLRARGGFEVDLAWRRGALERAEHVLAHVVLDVQGQPTTGPPAPPLRMRPMLFEGSFRNPLLAPAMKLLRARLYQLELEKRKENQTRIEGEKKDIGFGSQIRSYVLQPYQMIKDHRTKEQVGDVNRVLDGDIDGFIKSYLMKKAAGALAETVEEDV